MSGNHFLVIFKYLLWPQIVIYKHYCIALQQMQLVGDMQNPVSRSSGNVFH